MEMKNNKSNKNAVEGIKMTRSSEEIISLLKDKVMNYFQIVIKKMDPGTGESCL
jgi:hypothetical protein